MKHTTREAWLVAAGKETAKIIKEKAELDVPEIFISVGFPKGVGGKRRAVGVCHPTAQSKKGVHHVFICPTLGHEDVLPVVLHEQLHAAVGLMCKHRGAFKDAMKACGMMAPWTCSIPSPELLVELNKILDKIGEYPHDQMTPRLKGTGPGSRYRLYECECAIKIRSANDDLDITCNSCGSRFEKKS